MTSPARYSCSSFNTAVRLLAASLIRFLLVPLFISARCLADKGHRDAPLSPTVENTEKCFGNAFARDRYLLTMRSHHAL